MNLKFILNLMFKELNVYYQGYQEDINPHSEGYMQEFSKNEKSVKIIFDQINFKILNISENVELISGHSAESLKNKGIGFFLSFISLDHILFLYNWLKWFNKIIANCGTIPNIKESTTTFCGVKIKHKNGHIMRIMIRQRGLEFLDNGAMKVSVITVDDISHLVKGNAYWGRMAFELDDEQQIHHLMSTDNKDVAQDIISEREKDVLRLLSKGMESKDIGNQLFISTHTVDNHRRNMITRTGARDTTALLQICYMADIS